MMSTAKCSKYHLQSVREAHFGRYQAKILSSLFPSQTVLFHLDDWLQVTAKQSHDSDYDIPNVSFSEASGSRLMIFQ